MVLVNLYTGPDGLTYYQGILENANCRAILNLQGVDGVSNLKHCIMDMPDYLVSDFVEQAEAWQKVNGVMDGFTFSHEPVLGSLTDMQTKGVAFMYLAGSALLGDSVGLGKTVQCAGLINLLRQEYASQGKPFRYCFLGEKTSLIQLHQKLIRFTGSYAKFMPSAEKRFIGKLMTLADKDNFYPSIVGAHSLLNSSEFLSYATQHPFDLIIVDESSVLKTPSSGIYKNAELLFGVHNRKILLNATPLETSAMELYSQLRLLDKYFLPSREEFRKAYCVLKKSHFGAGFDIVGYKNVDQFRRLISLRYMARTREQLNAKYEDNDAEVVPVPMSEAQKVLVKKTSLYAMVYDYPPLVDHSIPATTESVPKAKALCEILDTVDTKAHKVLVYCRFIECQAFLKDVLETEGYGVGILNGTMSVSEREYVLRHFKNGEYDVLLTNVQKGIDLPNCDVCVLYTIDPNPQKMIQFEGRMTRSIDVVGKNLYLLVSKGKEERYVRNVLKSRVEASEDFTSAANSLTSDAIKQV